MEELLAIVAGVDEEEDLLVKIIEATWSAETLQLKVKISVIDCSDLGIWIIRCQDVLSSRLDSESAFSLQLTDSHPLLWQFKYPSASAFFFGKPADSDACVGTLYETHEKAVSSWIGFGSQFNSPRVSELLSTGNGLLAQGPVPLL